MRKIFARRYDAGVSHLREALNMSHASESLDHLPDRFAKVISQYDSLNVDPRFREDVFQVLNGSVEIAESMVDLTFPVEKAGEVISAQLAILSRVLLYLQSRPTATGYSILLPERSQLVGQYVTRQEAEDQLVRYKALGISPRCLVVPTKVLSLHAVQPPERSPTIEMPHPDVLETQGPDFPRGIAPDTLVPNPSAAELLHTPEADLSLTPTDEPGPKLNIDPELLRSVREVK